MRIKLLSVDYQVDFGAPEGRWYKPRPCQDFISNELIPTLKNSGIKIAEIVSDYRLPRPSETQSYCIPGTNGYHSLIPADLVSGSRWIKSMNSPSWIREGGGDANQKPGVPYSDPESLSSWLCREVGLPTEVEVVLLGLTLDCCILSTAQELYFRGYKAHYLYEAVDTYNGTVEEKQAMFRTPLPMWGQLADWETVRQKLESSPV